jgi:DNA-binding XRE family transcriptional regulator
MAKIWINSNIVVLRRRMGLTQLDFADLVECESRALANYEEYKVMPRLELAVRIAQATGVTVDDLLLKDLSIVEDKTATK